jgi:hypothetical protein
VRFQRRGPKSGRPGRRPTLDDQLRIADDGISQRLFDCVFGGVYVRTGFDIERDLVR